MKRAALRSLLALLGAGLLGACSLFPTGPTASSPASRQPEPTVFPAETGDVSPLAVDDGNSTGEVLIDFEACPPGRRRIDLPFGSTTYEVRGRHFGECVMAYGGEVENPDWDGRLPWLCLVPRSLGTMAFRTDSLYAVDFSPIEAYCVGGDD